MKKYILGAAAALAIVAPGVAAADTSGYIGAGYSTLDDEDDSDKDSALAINGAVVSSINESWNVQFDAQYLDMDHNGHNDAFSTVNAHVFTRNDNWAVGGLVGLTNRSGSSFYNLGVEGQMYFSNFTLGASYVFTDERNSSSNSEGSFLTVDGAFFLTPNTAIGGEVTWLDDEWDGEDGLQYVASVEHQFAGSPFSVGANYVLHDTEYSGGGDHEVESFGIFGRWNFGTSDLQTRSREGASFNSGASLARSNMLSW